MDSRLQNKANYVNWMKQKHPMIFTAAVRRAQSLGALDVGPGSDMGIAAASYALTDTSMAPSIGNVSADVSTPVSPPSAAAPAPVQSAWESAINSVIGAIGKIIPAVVGADQAKACLNMNTQRAAQGLPVIDCATAGIAPTFSVGVTPDVKTFLYIGLAVVIGVLIFKKTRD